LREGLVSARRWTAEVYRADRSQVGLRRPGDGRPQSEPFADSGCLYIIGPDEARALGEALIAAADAVAPRNLTCEPAPCPGCVGDLAGLVDAVCPTCRTALTVAFAPVEVPRG